MGKTYKAKNDSFIHRRIAGNDVLVSIGGAISGFNGYMELNGTAAFIWDYIREPKTSGEVKAALLEEFEIDEQTAEKDIDEFLAMLSARRMVEEDE